MFWALVSIASLEAILSSELVFTTLQNYFTHSETYQLKVHGTILRQVN